MNLDTLNFIRSLLDNFPIDSMTVENVSGDYETDDGERLIRSLKYPCQWISELWNLSY